MSDLPMSDLERCARAALDAEIVVGVTLFRVFEEIGGDATDWSYEGALETVTPIVRAVLSALIPPSEGTIKVGCSEYCLDDPKEYPSPSGIGDAFTAMIQHILNEGK